MENETSSTETTETTETTATDYSEQLSSIISLLEQQNFLLQAISEGTSLVLVYGLIVGPLLLLTTMLWWFFKQFLYKY